MRQLKERLDVLLVKKGFFSSRERAKIAIMEGDVYVGGAISDKAGTKIDVDAEITVRNDQCPFVGRGGYKLAKAIEVFGISLNGLIAMDIGASTGGFTDCMLQNGASRVYSVDVGYGQLDWKLRSDERVVNMEKVNVRYLDPATVPEKMDFISIDVSFISLKLILPVAVQLLKEDSRLVCLIKPQFERGKRAGGKKRNRQRQKGTPGSDRKSDGLRRRKRSDACGADLFADDGSERQYRISAGSGEISG